MQINLMERQQNFRNTTDLVIQDRSKYIKQELRQRIYKILEDAKDILSRNNTDNSKNNYSDKCIIEVRNRLFSVQAYCKTVEKTFIVVEQAITCDQYGIGGSPENAATLFRGSHEDASVAICITQQGSLLYRSDCPWSIYHNAEDIGVEKPVDLE